MGLDRRPRRGLRRRRRDCARQRRQRDRRDCIRCGNHDDYRGRRRSHQRLSDQDLGTVPVLVALGILYIIAGFVAFENPLLTAAWLTLILGAALCASGIVRIFLSFNMQHGSPWIWVVVSGVITLLLGLIILAHWPVSSLWTLGIFLGVDLVFAGASWIGIGIGLRQGSPV
jgi:uncharacterized membrane protein HdeD (DUF308 family)